MSDPFGPQDPRRPTPENRPPQQPQQPPRPPQQQQQPPRPPGPPQGPRPPQPPQPQPQPQPTYEYPWTEDDETIRRRRLLAIGAAVVLVVLVGAFFLLRNRDSANGPEKSAEYVQVGLTAYRQRDYATARVSYQKAIKADDTNAFAHYNLGLIQQVVDKNPLGAEAEYRKAIALKADLYQALFNLAIIRHDAGDDDEAIGLYKRTLQANDRFAAAHLNLGLILYERDPNSIEAQTHFTQARLLDSKLASRIPSATTSTTVKRSATTTTVKKR